MTLPDGRKEYARAAELPRHVAIIMDGNGRWALNRGFARILGHENASDTVRNITTECARLGLERLTLYAFSAENWSRPKLERDTLFKLLRKFMIKEIPTLMNNNIRLETIGDVERLPLIAREAIHETREHAAKNTGMILTLALSYGSRNEILRSVNAIAHRVKRGELQPGEITERDLRNGFYDPNLSDPDLLIRTAGEMRISNFLLWQISYSELHITQVLWPDFSIPHLHEALFEYTRRDRRYGGLSGGKK